MSRGLRQRDVKNHCLVHFNHFSFAVTTQLLDRDVLISRFIADNVLNRQQRTFLSFSSLGHGSYEFNSRRVRLPLAKKTSCNNRDKVFFSQRTQIFKKRFHYRRRHSRQLTFWIFIVKVNKNVKLVMRISAGLILLIYVLLL